MTLPRNPQVGQVYQFGTVVLDGVQKGMPSRPWRPDAHNGAHTQNGDTPQGNASSNIDIIDTVAGKEHNAAYMGKNAEGHDWYIGTYCCVCGVPWDRLNALGLIMGKEFTIDGFRVKIRSLRGGDGSQGTTAPLGNNEWDDFIANLKGNAAFPTPNAQDLQTSCQGVGSTHDNFWHWGDMYTWCQETYYSNASYRMTRGGYGARGCANPHSGSTSAYYGLRLVIEVLTSAPLISDDAPDDGSLGDKGGEFTQAFTVTDGGGGNFSVDVKLDGTTSLLSLTDQTTGEFSVTVPAAQWPGLSYGTHTLEISCKDGENREGTRTLTFRKTFAAPEISTYVSDGRVPTEGTVSFSDSYVEGGPTIAYKLQVASDAAFTQNVTTFQNAQNPAATSIDFNGLTMKQTVWMRAVGVSGSEERPGTAIKLRVGDWAEVVQVPIAPADGKMPTHCRPCVKGVFNGATMQAWATNNGLDDNPTWEPCTACVNVGPFFFTNKAKTATQWAINNKYRFDLSKCVGEFSITKLSR